MQKLKLTLSCLLACNLLAADFKPENINSLHYIGALSALSAAYVGCTWIQAQLSDTHNMQIENRYPYAQAWLDQMIKKYPDAHLNEVIFLQSAPWMSQGPMAWQSYYKKIYCPQASLQRIDDLYYEKLYPNFAKKLTLYQDSVHDEEIDLKIAEFLLLRLAYHCTTNTNWLLPLQFIVTAGVIAGMSEMMLNEFFYKAANYVIQAPIAAILLCNMIERQELQADEFAYLQSVDSNIFNGACAYFDDETLESTLLELQAPHYKRTEMLLEYIALTCKE